MLTGPCLPAGQRPSLRSSRNDELVNAYCKRCGSHEARSPFAPACGGWAVGFVEPRATVRSACGRVCPRWGHVAGPVAGRLGAEGRDGLVQRGEPAVVGDAFAEAVEVEGVQQAGVGAGKGEGDLAGLEVVQQAGEADPGGVVDVVDGPGVEDEPRTGSGRARRAPARRRRTGSRWRRTARRRTGRRSGRGRSACPARRARRSARRPSRPRARSPSGLYWRRMTSRIDTTIARMMPCSTPTAQTTTPVTTAMTNSLRRRRRSAAGRRRRSGRCR